MSSFIQQLLPIGVLVSHVVFVFLVAAFAFRKSWGGKIVSFIGSKAVLLGFLVTLAAVLGSLFYSVVLGYEPCELCIWQRIFLFPQLVLFAVALKKNDRSVFSYAVPLTIIASIISLYQIYATQLGGTSLLDCTSAGGACTRIYVNEFSYITIPVMSLTICAYLLFISYISKKHE